MKRNLLLLTVPLILGGCGGGGGGGPSPGPVTPPPSTPYFEVTAGVNNSNPEINEDVTSVCAATPKNGAVLTKLEGRCNDSDSWQTLDEDSFTCNYISSGNHTIGCRANQQYTGYKTISVKPATEQVILQFSGDFNLPRDATVINSDFKCTAQGFATKWNPTTIQWKVNNLDYFVNGDNNINYPTGSTFDPTFCKQYTEKDCFTAGIMINAVITCNYGLQEETKNSSTKIVAYTIDSLQNKLTQEFKKQNRDIADSAMGYTLTNTMENPAVALQIPPEEIYLMTTSDDISWVISILTADNTDIPLNQSSYGTSQETAVVPTIQDALDFVEPIFIDESDLYSKFDSLFYVSTLWTPNQVETWVVNTLNPLKWQDD
ncbi:hypothetical protein ACFL1H_02235 [Nanoarchaeota archaeon]